jgi:hypothetical protein
MTKAELSKVPSGDNSSSASTAAVLRLDGSALDLAHPIKSQAVNALAGLDAALYALRHNPFAGTWREGRRDDNVAALEDLLDVRPLAWVIG